MNTAPIGPRRLVAVIGGGTHDDLAVTHAEALGRALAGHGLSVVCGGRGGVMEGVARGLQLARRVAPLDHPAHRALAIGILPGPDAREANPWLDVALPTGLDKARDTVITRAAAAIIAVGGQAGTLGEIALAWQFGKPLCALVDSGGWAARVAGTAIDDRRTDVVFAADSPQAAADWANQVSG